MKVRHNWVKQAATLTPEQLKEFLTLGLAQGDYLILDDRDLMAFAAKVRGHAPRLRKDAPMPSLPRRAISLAAAVGTAAAAAVKAGSIKAVMTPPELKAERLAICGACDHLRKDRHCALCGCPVEKKVRLRTSVCADSPPRW